MISHIIGEVLLKGARFAIIDVSGVGYKVYISADTIRKIGNNGETASLWTHLVVRENALDLYGFSNYAEIEMFEMLISVSGVGPKSALGVMGVAPIDTLRTAIASGDTSYLTKVSGIGKKNAEKIVLELRDKLGILKNETAEGVMREESDVVDALASMGYSVSEAREALKGVPKEISGTSARIKEALKNMGK